MCVEIERYYVESCFEQSMNGLYRSNKEKNESRQYYWRDRVGFFAGELNRIDELIIERKRHPEDKVA